ncbi:hypothetical protein WN944_025625 [Citrus x changshan-huyou]|uniref:Uncharacterized protein n=1 Tax=Citrus x changshan-huyou TaxID=2935761 RepID=A0AAP0QDR8_9ROSI
MPSHSNYTLVYAASLATEVECQRCEEFEKRLDKLTKKFIDNATTKLHENMARNVSKKYGCYGSINLYIEARELF